MFLLSIVRCSLSAVALVGLYGLYQLDPGTATIADLLGLLHNEHLQQAAANVALLLLAFEVALPYIFGERMATGSRSAAVTTGMMTPVRDFKTETRGG